MTIKLVSSPVWPVRDNSPGQHPGLIRPTSGHHLHHAIQTGHWVLVLLLVTADLFTLNSTMK